MRCDEKKNERDNENENKGKFSEKVHDIIGAARVQNWNGKCFFFISISLSRYLSCTTQNMKSVKCRMSVYDGDIKSYWWMGIKWRSAILLS